MTRSASNFRIGPCSAHCGTGFRHLKLLTLLALALAPACKKAQHDNAPDAATVKPLPGIAREQIEKTNNADHEPLYTGATGVVEGTVTISGDEAPDITPYIEKIPDNCARAKELYGRLFREGPDRSVADALVAVTEYQGHLEPKRDHVDLTARDCGWDRRTIAMTFGQRIDVRSADGQAYIPQLLGGATGALLVAVPKGEAIPVLPREPGHYVLLDAMRLYSKADVFVVRYPTTDVTGIDGHYRIEGVPVGSAKISVLLPSTGSTAAKSVNIEANRSTRADLVLSFDRANFQPPGKGPSPAPSAAPSAAKQ
jgi:hypothetical protein